VNGMMRSPMIGEFVGTFIMILPGDGVVAGCILKRTKAEGAGWLVGRRRFTEKVSGFRHVPRKVSSVSVNH
jgi:glycerol uptake facilitator-like aquaporin